MEEERTFELIGKTVGYLKKIGLCEVQIYNLKNRHFLEGEELSTEISNREKLKEQFILKFNEEYYGTN
jgi:hypothetical protein